MTIALAQERQTSTGGAFIGALALAFSSAVTAGSAFHNIGQYSRSTPYTSTTFTDDKSNSYSGLLDSVNDTGGIVITTHAVAQNAAAGTTTCSINFPGQSFSFVSLWPREFTGAATTGQPLAHNALASSTNSSSVSLTLPSAPAMLSCLTSNANTQEVPVLDASFTASTLNPGWNYGGATSSTIAGHKRVTGTGTQTVTNTQASVDWCSTVLVALAEAGAGGATATYQPPPRGSRLKYRGPAYLNLPRNNLLVTQLRARQRVTQTPSGPQSYSTTLSEAASAADTALASLVPVASYTDAATAADIIGGGASLNPFVVQSVDNEGTVPPTTETHGIDTQFTSSLVVTGNALVGFHFCSNFAGTHTDASFTDIHSNTFNRQDLVTGVAGTSGSGALGSFVAVNVTGDTATKDTLTAGFTGGGTVEDFFAAYIIEVGNVIASPLVGHNGNVQLALTAGTNNITSGNITVSSAQVPCLLIGMAVNCTVAGTHPAPTPGTGMTALSGSIWGFQTTNYSGCVATRLITTAGTYAAVFNQASSSTEDVVTAAMILQGPTSAGSGVLGAVTTISEAASAADAESATGGTASNTVTEAASAADALSNTAIFPRSYAEAAASADSLATLESAAGTYSDAASAADALSAAGSSYAITTSEAASGADSLGSQQGALGSYADAASAGDTATNINALAGTYADAANATDSASSAAAFPRAYAEAAAAADAQTPGNSVASSTSDAASAADALGAGTSPAGATSDPASAGDGLSGLLSTSGALTEASSATDAVIPGSGVALALSEAASAADAAAVRSDQSQGLAEIVNAADAESATGGTAGSAISESVNATDTLATTAALVRAYTEAASALDTLGSTWNSLAALSEPASAADTVTTGGLSSGTYADTVTAGDALSAAESIGSAIGEAIGALDALVALQSEPTAYSEPGAATDAYLTAGVAAAYADAVQAQDALVTIAQLVTALAESAAGSDAYLGIINSLVPVLLGSLRYYVKRTRTRRFMISNQTYQNFEPMDREEKIPLTFDMTPDLALADVAGATLQGTPVVEIDCVGGVDASPQSILNGAVGFNQAATYIIVPVKGGPGNRYRIKVVCNTTQANLQVALTGYLPMFTTDEN